jgi:hypothetical protein
MKLEEETTTFEDVSETYKICSKCIEEHDLRMEQLERESEADFEKHRMGSFKEDKE